MISSRIKTTLTCLFATEMLSYMLAYVIWAVFFCEPPLNLLPGDEVLYYKDANIFTVCVLFVLIIASSIHLKYEIENFSDYASSSIYEYYLRTFAAITCIAFCGAIGAHMYLVHISAKKIIVVYTLTVTIDFALKMAMGFLLKKLYTSPANIRQMLIVGNNTRAADFARLTRKNPQLGFVVLGYVDAQPDPDPGMPYFGKPDKVEELLRLHAIDVVGIFLPIRSFYDINRDIISTAEDFGIAVYYMTNIFEPDRAKVRFSSVGSINNIMYYSAPTDDSWQLQCKRVFDIVFSLALILLLWPLMLGIAVYIAHTSGSPVFFTQHRVGYNKRIFPMYKFRTMVPDAEKKLAALLDQNEADGPAFKITNDPRLIRGGAFLRRYSLDELPQLWNVLCGDMSVVGPRPLSLRDYGLMPEDWQRRRFSMKPGLTCIWQVSGRNDVKFDEWMQMDLQYIDTWNLKNDFSIVFKTIFEVLRGGGK